MKISVIIPCYNVEKYIDRCLSSIERQTIGMDKLEIILVDDKSPDDTLNHLFAFEGKYPENVIVVVNEENVKAAEARNIGLSYASGEYISFVDADDMLDSTMLEKMLAKAEKYNCDMVECDYQWFADEKECSTASLNKDKFFDFSNTDARKEFLVGIGLKSAVWARLYRRSVIEDNCLRFITGALYEDVHFSIIALLLCKSVYFIGESFYFYFDNSNGVYKSSDKEQLREEVSIVRSTVLEMDSRGMLDDALQTLYQEIEMYFMLKSVADPISLMASKNPMVPIQDINYFIDNFLLLFPEAGKNKYLKTMSVKSSLWKAIYDLLNKAL